MEKRGSGLRKMRELTEKLPNFLLGKEPYYKTEASSFFTTFYNLNWNENDSISVEEVANRVNNTLEKDPVNREKFGEIAGNSVSYTHLDVYKRQEDYSIRRTYVRKIPALAINFQVISELSALSWEAYDHHLSLGELTAHYNEVMNEPRISR